LTPSVVQTQSYGYWLHYKKIAGLEYWFSCYSTIRP